MILQTLEFLSWTFTESILCSFYQQLILHRDESYWDGKDAAGPDLRGIFLIFVIEIDFSLQEVKKQSWRSAVVKRDEKVKQVAKMRRITIRIRLILSALEYEFENSGRQKFYGSRRIHKYSELKIRIWSLNQRVTSYWWVEGFTKTLIAEWNLKMTTRQIDRWSDRGSWTIAARMLSYCPWRSLSEFKGYGRTHTQRHDCSASCGFYSAKIVF